MKHFNINSNVNNNNNVSNDNTNVSNSNDVNNNNTNDDDDGKIRDKISGIRVMLSRLGDIVTKNDREKIKKRALWNRN